MSNLVTPSILSAPVSFFETCYQTDRPKTGTFLQIVTSKKLASKYAPLLARIRSEPDEQRRKELKKELPCFTPSGTFKYKDKDGFLRHSGLAQFDIDQKDNPWLTAQNAPAVRDDIANFQHVAYCALSASGAGVWGVIPIAYPERHDEQADAIAADFAGWGINLDTKCKPVTSYRFWSFDADAHINPEAVTYWKFPPAEPVRSAPTWTRTESGDLARRAAQYLIDTGATVAFGYEDYLRITAACRHEFDDEGEAIAWAILENSPAFLVSNFRKDFAAHCRSFKRTGGNVTTGGTLVHLAKQKGFQTGSVADPPRARESLPAAMPAPRTEPDTWQPVTMHGATYEVKTTPEGYPAIWDDPRPLVKARAENIRDRAVSMCEAAGWTFEGEEPFTERDAEICRRLLIKAGKIPATEN